MYADAFSSTCAACRLPRSMRHFSPYLSMSHEQGHAARVFIIAPYMHALYRARTGARAFLFCLCTLSSSWLFFAYPAFAYTICYRACTHMVFIRKARARSPCM